MNEYLLALLFTLETKAKEKEKKLKSVVKKLKGKVLATEQREEDLAYPVAKQTRAQLLKVFFALDGKDLLEFKKEIQGVEPLRYLIVKFPYSKVKAKEEDKTKTAAKKSKKPKIKKRKRKDTKAKLDKALKKVLKG
ncbi:hypothetical protein J7K05_00960 [bacterium]|nr:hypothetical protein [bacterium]